MPCPDSSGPFSITVHHEKNRCLPGERRPAAGRLLPARAARGAGSRREGDHRGRQRFRPRHEYAGEVRARVESRLGFRVGGKLIKRQAELGQQVKAGQVLAQLDPQDYRLAADAARAQVAAAATNRDLAAADFKRYKALKDQNFISGAELERREATLKAAQAQLEQAQAQLAVQGNQTGYTRADGRCVGRGDGRRGRAGPGRGGRHAGGADRRRTARATWCSRCPKTRWPASRLGAPVAVRVWAQDTRTAGKVREVAASADPVTRTYPVKVALDGRRRRRRWARRSTCVPEAAAHAGAPVIKLPTSALRQEGQATAVWVLDTASMTVQVAADPDCHGRRQRGGGRQRPAAGHAGGERWRACAVAGPESHHLSAKSAFSAAGVLAQAATD